MTPIEFSVCSQLLRAPHREHKCSKVQRSVCTSTLKPFRARAATANWATTVENSPIPSANVSREPFIVFKNEYKSLSTISELLWYPTQSYALVHTPQPNVCDRTSSTSMLARNILLSKKCLNVLHDHHHHHHYYHHHHNHRKQSVHILRKTKTDALVDLTLSLHSKIMYSCIPKCTYASYTTTFTSKFFAPSLSGHSALFCLLVFNQLHSFPHHTVRAHFFELSKKLL